MTGTPQRAPAPHQAHLEATARVKVCVFAPVPPPMVGSSYAVQLLLESRFSRELDVLHIDASYASSVADMGTVRPAKLLKSVGYLARLISAARSGSRLVLMTVGFSRSAFIRDALIIVTLKLLTRATIVLWANNNDLDTLHSRSGKVLRHLINAALTRADYLVTVGEALRKPYRRFLPDDRILAIPNGIPESQPVTSRGSDVVRVLYLSNMMSAKGWRVLLDCAKRIATGNPAVHFDFFGAAGPDSSAESISQAFAQAACDRIQFHGPVSGAAKDAAFAGSDIFCLPTMYQTEALPLSILEAFRSGLPVVSTPIGAIAEAVEDDRGGFLVPAGDAAALEAALRNLIADRELRERMGAFNRGRFEERYVMERVADQWLNLFKRLAAQSP